MDTNQEERKQLNDSSSSQSPKFLRFSGNANRGPSSNNIKSTSIIEEENKVEKKSDDTPKKCRSIPRSATPPPVKSGSRRRNSVSSTIHRKHSNPVTSPRVFANINRGIKEKDHKENNTEEKEENLIEKLKKNFNDANLEYNIEVYDCKFGRKMKNIAGRLFITINGIYFIGKMITKEWSKSFLDVDKDEKIKKDGLTKSTALKILKYKFSENKTVLHTIYFKTQELRDKAWKTIHKQLIDGSGHRNTALHMAIKNDEIFRVKAILDRDVKKLEKYNIHKHTPLVMACINGNKAMVDVILDYYKKFNIDINTTDSSTGDHLLHVLCHEAINDDILKEIINYPRMEINATNMDGTTPLHYFCKSTQSRKCDELLEEMIKVGVLINAETKKRETPIHRAMQNQNGVGALLVHSLLKYHPSLNIVTGTTRETPLHYAVRLGRIDLLAMMINAGSDIRVRNIEGEDALQIAIKEYAKVDRRDFKTSENYRHIIKILKNVQRMRDILSDCGLQDSLENFIREEYYTNLRNFVALNEKTLQPLGIGLGPLYRLMRHLKTLEEELNKEEEQERITIELNKKSLNQQDIELLRTDLKFSSGNGSWEINSRTVELSQRLGRGTSGEVFKAMWNQTEVAVKILTNTDSDSEISEFKKEFQILIRLNSPYVIKFYGATICPYIGMVMEYCEHGSLFDYLKKNQLSWLLAIRFAINTAEGIKDLHRHEPPIIHRDLKSLNILVTRDLKCKVCDFGLSRLYAADNVTFAKLCGSPAYVAPEIFNSKIGENSASSKSDIYSLGIVFWELINSVATKTYSAPYSEYGLSGNAVLICASLDSKRPSIPVGCPSELSDLYISCVQSSPNLRPNASKVASTLKAIEEKYKKNPNSLFENISTKDREISALSSPSNMTTKQDIQGRNKSSHKGNVNVPENDSAYKRKESNNNVHTGSDFPGWNRVKGNEIPPRGNSSPNKIKSTSQNQFKGWTKKPTPAKSDTSTGFPGWLGRKKSDEGSDWGRSKKDKSNHESGTEFHGWRKKEK